MLFKKEPIFRCFSVFACVVMLAGSILILNVLLLPKWLDTPSYEPVTEIVGGFYAEPADSIDVLFLGSSHVFCGINPLLIYQETGLHSYDFSTGTQRTWVSYYYLLEALKTQSPSVVVLDTFMLFDDTQNTEPRNRMALDYLHNSPNKYAAIQTSMQPDESLISYILPVFRYHERIFDLTKADFLWLFENSHYNPLHGYRFEYMDQITPVTFMSYEQDHTTEFSFIWDNECKSRYYLNQIVKTCREQEIKLALITIPVTTNWSIEKQQAIADYAAANHIDYFDFVPEVNAIGLSPETDFYDSTHLNIYGSDKFSRYLGRMIKDIYYPKWSPAPSAELTEQWEKDLTQYLERFHEKQSGSNTNA